MRRLVGVGLGAGLCVVFAALPARATTLGPVTVPSLPPLEVAPGPVTIGPVTIDPQASVGPTGTDVEVATSGLPLSDGGPDLGLTVGRDGAQVGVGGIDAGVALSPPPVLVPVVPVPPGGATAPVAAEPGVRSSHAGPSPSPNGVPPALSPSVADPQVVGLANRSPVVSGGVDATRHRNWWSLATGAARSYFLWIVLLLAAFIVRNRVVAEWRDQRGVRVARSA